MIKKTASRKPVQVQAKPPVGARVSGDSGTFGPAMKNVPNSLAKQRLQEDDLKPGSLLGGKFKRDSSGNFVFGGPRRDNLKNTIRKHLNINLSKKK